MFCRQLYMDEHTSKNFQSIRRKFRAGQYPSGTFVIILSKTSGRVEYFDCKAFKQKYYKETGNYPLIVGLAKNKESAEKIIIKMIEETVEKTGNADVKAYLKSRSDAMQKAYFKRHEFIIVEQEGEE